MVCGGLSYSHTVLGLGPLLFLIYINDLPDYIQNNSTVKLFADDTIIYHPINNQQTL